MLYNTKVVTAGKLREVRTYAYKREHGSTLASLGQDRARSSSKKEGKPRADNIKRAQNKIKYLLHANVRTTRPIFVTLTYRENQGDRKKTVADVSRFLRALRVLYPSLAYLYVLERQERGAFHAHMVIFNVPFISFETLENAWTFGYTNVKRIQDEMHISRYLAKYLSKENYHGMGVRKYSRSKNLTEEQVEYGINILTDPRQWTLDRERRYGTLFGTYKIAIYKYENSG